MKFQNLPIQTEIERFKSHLEQQNNNRILLSGIFGIGKTYFIKKFFETEDEYISITLNPVNYSVSPNQDIFELVKYDIAFQLFAKNPNFEKVTFDKYFASQFFILENYKSIISNLVENLSKIDHRINSIIEPTVKLGKQIEEFQKQTNVDDEKALFEFLNFFKDQKGTAREEDSLTELLSALISSLKQDNKKIVLVIDDLDRIDPEHIFRLLNIFSAHFDFQGLEGENKFGFDKIILICDIENIRGIFHNKYGADIDFSGYIDKFYSTEIFYYRIEKIINNNITHFLSSLKSPNQIFHQHINVSSSYIKNDLELLLSYFINSNTLSLRSLLSSLNKELNFPDYTIKVKRNSLNRVYSGSTPVLFVLEALEKILGGKTNLLKAIDKVIDRYPLISLERYGNYTDDSIGSLAMIAGYSETHLFPSVNDESYSYDIQGYRIEYKIQTYSHSYGVQGYSTRISPTISNGDPTETISNYILPYFQLLKNAYIAKNEIVKDFR